MNIKIYIEKLSFFNIPWFIILKNILNHCEIEYVTKSKNKIINKLIKILNIKIVETDYNREMLFANGSIREKGRKEALEVSRDLWDNLFVNKRESGLKQKILNFDEYKIQSFYEKYIATQIEKFMVFMYIIKWKKTNGVDKNFDHIYIYVNAQHYILKNKIRKILQLEKSAEIYSLKNKKKYIEGLYNFYKLTISLLKISLKITSRKIFNKRAKRIEKNYGELNNLALRKTSPEYPKYAIEFAWGVEKGKLSELFWFDYSNINPENILYYFKRNINTMSPGISSIDSVIKNLKKKGFKYILLNKYNDIEESSYLFYLKTKDYLQIKNIILIIGCTKFIHWKSKIQYLNIVIEMLLETYKWKNFFADTNSKLHSHTNESQLVNIPQLAACDIIDCISIGRQKSYQPYIYPTASHQPYDVYFLWNKLTDFHYKDNKFSDIKNIIYTGPLYEYVTKKNKQEIEEIQKKIVKDNNLEFTFTFYDHAAIDTRELLLKTAINKEKLIYIYKQIITFINNNRKVVMILKPIKSIRKFLPEVMELLHPLISEGRVFIVKNSSPPVAALFSDMVVGITLSSAVIESLPFMKNKRGVHIDYQRNITNVLWKHGRHSVVFPDIDSFLDKFQEHLDKGCRTDLGSHKKIEKLICLNQTTEGYKKAAVYIDYIFKGLEKYKKKSDVIKSANKNYIKKYNNFLIEKN